MKGLFSCTIGKTNCFPYIAVVTVQLISTGMSLLSKASISGGMKPAIFVTYIQAFAIVFLAPFAYFLDRKVSTPLTFKVLCKIAVVATFGITLGFNFCMSVFNYASATFVNAMSNTVPAMVFIMAVLLRLESLAITQWHGRAKVVGCAVCLSGAMVFTFFKGPPMYHVTGKQTTGHSASTPIKEDWVKGFFLMLGYNLATSFWLMAQAPIQKEYSAKLRITTLQCFFSSITSAIWAVATQRDISAWKLGWDVNLLSVIYTAILVSGILYWLQIWVVDMKGPVFASMFSPLSLILTAFLSALIFKEILHWGSVLGAILLVAGLYSYLWGKSRETNAQQHEEKLKQSKDDVVLECITTTGTPPTNEPDKKEGRNN